jgi:hypothetical protein
MKDTMKKSFISKSNAQMTDPLSWLKGLHGPLGSEVIVITSSIQSKK